MRIHLSTKSTEHATYGDGSVFNDENDLIFEFKSLELPWRDNKKNESCILPVPGGTLDYLVQKMMPTEKRPYTYFQVLNVEGRTGILWHPGNYTRQILGCILPGEAHLDLDKDGIIDITNTTATLKTLAALMPDRFKLTIDRA